MMIGQTSAHRLVDLLVTLENGGRPKGGVSNIREGVPSIGGEHITRSGAFDFGEIRFIPQEYYRSMKRGKIKRDDILLVKDGATTGKVAFVDERFPYPEAAVNEHVFIVRPSEEKILPRFLFFFLHSSIGQARILSNFHGAAQGGINSSFAENVVVPTPSRDLQEKATQVLDTAYKLREKRQLARELTNKIVQSAFLRMFGNPATNPMRWKLAVIGDVVDETQYGLSNALDDDPSHIPIIRMNNITTDGRFDPTALRYVDIDKNTFEKYRLEKGDILFNRTNSRELVGKTGLINGDEKFVFASYLIRVRVKKTVATPEYLWAFLNSAFGKQILLRMARGAIGQANINTQELRSIELALPPLEVQARFSSFVGRLRPLSQHQIESTAEIRELFDALMYKTFNGEPVVV